MPAEENIALIYRGLDAFSRGDFDAGVEDMQPDVEWHVSFRLPDLPLDKAVYEGHDEVRRLWAAFRSGWAELTVTLEEVVDAREDSVVVRTRFVGRGSASGIEVDRTIFYVFEIAAGKLKRLRPFDTEREALEAAGLRSSAILRGRCRRRTWSWPTERLTPLSGATSTPSSRSATPTLSSPREPPSWRAGSYRGHNGIRKWWMDILEVFPDFSIEIQEVRDLGNVTVARQSNRGRGTGSDALTEATVWTVTEWRHGRGVWARVCGSEAEALEAAGLRE